MDPPELREIPAPSKERWCLLEFMAINPRYCGNHLTGWCRSIHKANPKSVLIQALTCEQFLRSHPAWAQIYHDRDLDRGISKKILCAAKFQILTCMTQHDTIFDNDTWLELLRHHVANSAVKFSRVIVESVRFSPSEMEQILIGGVPPKHYLRIATMILEHYPLHTLPGREQLYQNTMDYWIAKYPHTNLTQVIEWMLDQYSIDLLQDGATQICDCHFSAWDLYAQRWSEIGVRLFRKRVEREINQAGFPYISEPEQRIICSSNPIPGCRWIEHLWQGVYLYFLPSNYYSLDGIYGLREQSYSSTPSDATIAQFRARGIDLADVRLPDVRLTETGRQTAISGRIRHTLPDEELMAHALHSLQSVRRPKSAQSVEMHY